MSVHTKFDTSPDNGVTTGYDWPFPEIGDFEAAISNLEPTLWMQPAREYISGAVSSPYAFPDSIADSLTWTCGSTGAVLSQLDADGTSPNGLPYLDLQAAADDGVEGTLPSTLTDQTTYIVFKPDVVTAVSQVLFGFGSGATRAQLYIASNGQLRWSQTLAEITTASASAAAVTGSINIAAITQASDKRIGIYTRDSLTQGVTQTMVAALTATSGLPCAFGKAPDNTNPLNGKLYMGVRFGWNALDNTANHQIVMNALRQIYGFAAL